MIHTKQPTHSTQQDSSTSVLINYGTHKCASPRPLTQYCQAELGDIMWLVWMPYTASSMLMGVCIHSGIILVRPLRLAMPSNKK